MALAACDGDVRARGVIVGLESEGLRDVRSVTLRLDDGTDLRLTVAPEAVRGAHPPNAGHLRDHMTHGDRVLVRYRLSAEGASLLELEDGG